MLIEFTLINYRIYDEIFVFSVFGVNSRWHLRELDEFSTIHQISFFHVQVFRLAREYENVRLWKMETRWNYELARTTRIIQNNSTYVSSSRNSNGYFFIFGIDNANMRSWSFLHDISSSWDFLSIFKSVSMNGFLTILTWINNCFQLFLAIKINRNEMNSEKNKSSILDSFKRETWDKFLTKFLFSGDPSSFFNPEEEINIQSNESEKFFTWQMMRVNWDWN